jgi:hypothetical protein
VEIIGSGYYRVELEVQAARLGIRDRIFFRNSVPSRDVPQVLSKIDMLVVPSLTRSNWKEQFGRVIVEAMACEVPVIGSDSGEIPNVIGDAGVIVPEDDPETLALRIWELMEDRVRRLELGARGRQRVLRFFTQQQVALRYYNLYQAMLYGNVPYELPPPPPVVIGPPDFQPGGSSAPPGPRAFPPAGMAAVRTAPLPRPEPRPAPPAAEQAPASPASLPDDEPEYPPGYGDRPAAPPPYPDPEPYAGGDTAPLPPVTSEPTVPDWWPANSTRPARPPERPWWRGDQNA